jgi:hypothetical protein
MIVAIALALLPVAFVAVLVTHDLRPWRRTLNHIRALPERTAPYRSEVNQ